MDSVQRQHRKLQLCQLHMLEDVDRICKEAGLNYFLIGGCAIGAVRHGGFIPWDDDLDIGMYRDDYERFQKLIRESHADKYFLQNSETDPRYPRVIAKLRLKGTIQQERSFESVDCNNGVYIDFFPIDYVSRNEGLAMQLRGKLVRLCFAYKTVRSGANNRHRMGLKKAMRGVAALIPARWVDHLMTAVCTMENRKTQAYSTLFLGAYTWKKEMHRSETIGAGRRIRFETGVFNGPYDVDTFLRNVYRNYMLLPPPEKRIAHKLTRLDFGPYEAMLEREVSEEEQRPQKERRIGYLGQISDPTSPAQQQLILSAKKQCDFLIVGVCGAPSMDEAKQAASALPEIDMVVTQATTDPAAIWDTHRFQILFQAPGSAPVDGQLPEGVCVVAL